MEYFNELKWYFLNKKITFPFDNTGNHINKKYLQKKIYFNAV